MSAQGLTLASMVRKAATYLGLAVGLSLGFALSYIPTVNASRNSAGTYALPAGQPVVSGTTITASVHNTLASDIATELTSSLDRSGRGAMLAPLQCTNGTVAAPSLTFATDLDTGMFRVTTNSAALTAGGVNAFGWTSTGTTLPLGVNAAQTSSNTDAIVATGNGTGRGMLGTGGTTNGVGVHGIGGATNGVGTSGQGTGTGAGLYGTGGGTSGSGVTATGGTPNGSAVIATGTGTGWGGTFVGGATGGGAAFAAGGSPTVDTATRYAIETTGGHIKLSGGNPTSTQGWTNVLTPMNLVKAWGSVSVTSGGTVSVVTGRGFNVSGASRDGSGNITLTFTTALTTAGIAIVTGSYGASLPAQFVSSIGTGSASVTVYNGAVAVDCGGGTYACALNFLVLGAQ